ncbi:FAD-dependent monooxygenase [uncultured Amnibacterium sp.]|uniref:FAD-dependent monooxygenase n=1 Tax=uncultured Amnibacterium sp. TaxID=1631851 RepID=UPI0035CBB5D9
MAERSTTVAISGGGPAGILLGLLLARQGVKVVVLEQHADFLRDFRGDTVHPMTQQVLADLGLLDEFDAIVRGRMTAIEFATTDGVLVRQDLASVAPRSARFTDIALAPQWDLLDLLVRKAQEYPTFTLELEARTTGVLRTARGHVRGLRYRQGGVERAIEAVVTVAADGRRSVLRPEMGTDLIELGSPIDVLWFRIDRAEGEPAELRGVIGRGGAVVAINRRDYWQVAFLVAKGTDAAIRAAGLPAFRDRVAGIAPWMQDRLEQVVDWDDVKLLSVGIERLRRWSAPGILAIGDAAHTMSPLGGIGINLAVADAVAAANLVGPHLLRAQADPGRHRRVFNPAILDRVQRRRQAATVLTQRIQVLGQDRVLAVVRAKPGTTLLPPAPVLAVLRGPVARLLPRVFGFGIRPERVER